MSRSRHLSYFSKLHELDELELAALQRLGLIYQKDITEASYTSNSNGKQPHFGRLLYGLPAYPCDKTYRQPIYIKKKIILNEYNVLLDKMDCLKCVEEIFEPLLQSGFTIYIRIASRVFREIKTMDELYFLRNEILLAPPETLEAELSDLKLPVEDYVIFSTDTLTNPLWTPLLVLMEAKQFNDDENDIRDYKNDLSIEMKKKSSAAVDIDVQHSSLSPKQVAAFLETLRMDNHEHIFLSDKRGYLYKSGELFDHVKLELSPQVIFLTLEMKEKIQHYYPPLQIIAPSLQRLELDTYSEQIDISLLPKLTELKITNKTIPQLIGLENIPGLAGKRIDDFVELKMIKKSSSHTEKLPPIRLSEHPPSYLSLDLNLENSRPVKIQQYCRSALNPEQNNPDYLRLVRGQVLEKVHADNTGKRVTLFPHDLPDDLEQVTLPTTAPPVTKNTWNFSLPLHLNAKTYFPLPGRSPGDLLRNLEDKELFTVFHSRKKGKFWLKLKSGSYEHNSFSYQIGKNAWLS